MAKRFASGALGKLAISLRSSFWFLPLLIVLGTAGLSTGMVAIDHQLGGLEEHWPKVFAMDASGARDLMSTIAASMMTVAGVVFSITIVALAQASTQYTSRVLRNFMRDRRNQVVLGVFLGVFAYCIGVMRSIPGHGDVPFVPHLALFGGLVLVLVAVTFLAVFIHHVAAQIQSGAIAKGIADDTLATIETLFPEPLEGDDVTPDFQLPEGLRWHAVRAPQLGYIERVDPHALLDFAREHEVVVRMERNVGDFASPDRTIASIGAAQAPDADAMDDLSGLFAIDSYRSIEQDIAFGLRQLVDVALKSALAGHQRHHHRDHQPRLPVGDPGTPGRPAPRAASAVRWRHAAGDPDGPGFRTSAGAGHGPDSRERARQHRGAAADAAGHRTDPRRRPFACAAADARCQARCDCRSRAPYGLEQRIATPDRAAARGGERAGGTTRVAPEAARARVRYGRCCREWRRALICRADTPPSR